MKRLKRWAYPFFCFALLAAMMAYAINIAATTHVGNDFGTAPTAR